MRILLVEDDEMLGSAVRDHLAAHGHAVDWMTRLAKSADARATTDYELVLLDLNLPDGNGLGFLRSLRKAGDTVPVIILTAMDQLTTRIEGLNAGADDYLVKPFDLGELIARVAAVARRYAGNPNPLLEIGPLSIDHAHRTAAVNGTTLDLTAREWAVLDRLSQHPGVVVSRSQLEDALFEFGAEVESNAVEVYVSRLRKKIGHPLIQTSRGLGYRLAKQ
jgi:two-component system OmpR family response regulator